MIRGQKHRNSRCIRILAILLLVPAQPAPVAAASVDASEPVNRPAESAAPGNYDIRVGARRAFEELAEAYGRERLAPMARAAEARLGFRPAALAQLAAEAGAEVKVSALIGGAEVVRSSRGPLTSPAPGRRAERVVLDFLRAHRDLYGLTAGQVSELEVLGVSRSASGLTMVRLRQWVARLPVFQGETRAIVDREGRLVRTTGLLVPGVDEALLPEGALLSPQMALAAAMASVGIEVDAGRVRSRATGPEGRSAELVADHPEITRAVASDRVWFPLAAGVLVPAWSQVTFTRGPGDWYTLVDATTGTLLWRKNLRAHLQEARFSVYAQEDGETPADSPAPASPNAFTPGSGAQPPAIGRTIVEMLSAYDPAASPAGWIPDGGDTTTGNNVDAYLDRDGDDLPDLGTLDRDGRPRGNPDPSGRSRDFLTGAGDPRN
jgi:hypothetical protein